MKQLDIDSNYELIRLLEPFVANKLTDFNEFEKGIRETLNTYHPELQPHSEAIIQYMALYYRISEEGAQVGGDDAFVDTEGAPALPTVDAGRDVTTSNGTLELQGTLSNNRQPVENLFIEWRKKKGPGTVMFDDKHSLKTHASFSDQGLYELSLTVNDGLFAVSDEVQVRVGVEPEVVLETTTTGGSSGSTTVSTADPVAVTAGRVYVATVSSTNYRPVTEVSGLGGTWKLVADQAGGRDTTGVSVFVSTNATTSEVVTATSARRAPSTAVISVAEYSGVDLAAPIGAFNSANTNGVAGASSTDGQDTGSYSVPLTTTSPSSLVVAAVALRNRTTTPSERWSHPVRVKQGKGGNATGMVIFDQSIPTPDAVTVEGTTVDGRGKVKGTDWAVLAIELIAG